MHGLFNRALQCFLSDTYGPATWEKIAAGADIHPEGFEAMLLYDDATTQAVLCSAAGVLDKPAEALLEDMGHYLVAHPARAGLRRLLRFGGADLEGFLASLDDLPARARLALPDMDMPCLAIREHGGGAYELEVRHRQPGLAHVVLGALRAMADDYGALASADLTARPGGATIAIQVFTLSHARGRDFALTAALER
jgi:hypothetical protein